MPTLPDVHYGKVTEAPLDWREYEDVDTDDTDEVQAKTDPGVVAMLGFDPLELEGM